MFGINMLVKHNGVEVRLRPFAKSDMPELVKYFSSMKIHMYTKGLFAQTLENEEEWYERNRTDSDACTWAIQPVNSEVPIGVTSLHHIKSRENSCSSGIIIWDPNWWKKGVASAAHLGRTYFAAEYLNRFTIRSSVRDPNEASRRALQRVGYTVWGKEPCTVRRDGVWLDTYHLMWLHPDRVSVYYPEGLPEFLNEGVKKAENALKTAREEVKFL